MKKGTKLIKALILAKVYSLSFYKFDSFIPPALSLGTLIFLFSWQKKYQPGFGFIAGLYGFLSLSSFIPFVLVEQTSMSNLSAHIIHLIVAGIVPGIFFETILFLSFLIYRKKQNFLYSSILLSSIFTIIELTRVSLSLAGVWGHPALFFTDYSISPYICRFTGKEGLSFIFFLTSLIISKVLCLFYDKDFKKMLILSIFPILISAIFLTPIPFKKVKNSYTQNFSIIHPGIPYSSRWHKKNRLSTLTTYLSMSKKAQEDYKSTIILWPETSLWWDPLYDEETKRLMELFSKTNNAIILFGAPSINFNDENIKENKNSIFILSKKGEIKKIYDKIRLIPFLEKQISTPDLFLNKDNFFYKEGSGTRVKEVRTFKNRSIKAKILICYEVNFLPKTKDCQLPGIIIQFSNDSWFKNSHASKIELNILRLLSMEKRLPSIRVTGYGIAGFIDENGRVIKKSPIDKAAILNSKIYIPPNPKKTFYSKFPYLFTLIIAFPLLLTLFLKVKNYYTKKLA